MPYTSGLAGAAAASIQQHPTAHYPWTSTSHQHQPAAGAAAPHGPASSHPQPHSHHRPPPGPASIQQGPSHKLGSAAAAAGGGLGGGVLGSHLGGRGGHAPGLRGRSNASSLLTAGLLSQLTSELCSELSERQMVAAAQQLTDRAFTMEIMNKYSSGGGGGGACGSGGCSGGGANPPGGHAHPLLQQCMGQGSKPCSDEGGMSPGSLAGLSASLLSMPLLPSLQPQAQVARLPAFLPPLQRQQAHRGPPRVEAGGVSGGLAVAAPVVAVAGGSSRQGHDQQQQQAAACSFPGFTRVVAGAGATPASEGTHGLASSAAPRELVRPGSSVGGPAFGAHRPASNGAPRELLAIVCPRVSRPSSAPAPGLASSYPGQARSMGIGRVLHASRTITTGNLPSPTGCSPILAGNLPSPTGCSPILTGNLPSPTGCGPIHTGSVPCITGSIPGLMGSIPSPTGSVPGPTGSIPGIMGSTPGPTGSVPGPTGSTPGHVGSVPGLTGSIPGSTGGIIARRDTRGASPSTDEPGHPPSATPLPSTLFLQGSSQLATACSSGIS